MLSLLNLFLFLEVGGSVVILGPIHMLFFLPGMFSPFVLCADHFFSSWVSQLALLRDLSKMLSLTTPRTLLVFFISFSYDFSSLAPITISNFVYLILPLLVQILSIIMLEPTFFEYSDHNCLVNLFLEKAKYTFLWESQKLFFSTSWSQVHSLNFLAALNEQ